MSKVFSKIIKFTEYLLEDKKISNKSYSSEKINSNIKQNTEKSSNKNEKYILSIYNTIKNKNRTYSSYYYDKKALLNEFYNKAKILEKLEDNYDYDYKGNEYESYLYYFCDYSDLDFASFRKYFTWRTKVRNGEYLPTSLEFLNLYIKELINEIGVNSEYEAIIKLIEIYNNYVNQNYKIKYSLRNIIKYFYILSDLDFEYSDIELMFKDNKLNVSNFVEDLLEKNYDDKIEILNDISSYKILKSKFLDSKYGYLLYSCLPSVLKDIDCYFKTIDIDFINFFIQSNIHDYYFDICDGLYINNIESKIQDLKGKIVNISKVEKYSIGKKSIICEDYVILRYRKFIGYILKAVESNLREYVGYRSISLIDIKELKNEGIAYYYGKTKLFNRIIKSNIESIIRDSVFNYLRNSNIEFEILKKEKNIKIENNDVIFDKMKKIEFNKGNFEKIRENSIKIQNKLIIDDESEEFNNSTIIKDENEKINIQISNIESADTITDLNDNEFHLFKSKLFPEEIEILKILIEKENSFIKVIDIAKEHNTLPEVIISNINEKAMNFIGDNLIDLNNKEIYQDYLSDVKYVIK